jgi:very-short-patch-repair endonuclease
LYFGKGRVTRVQIGSPSVEELYRQFTADQKSRSFPHIRDTTVSELEIASEEVVSKLERRIIPGDLETVPPVGSVEELRRLYNQLERLRKGTKTLSEEQGVHTLFLALGLLEWREAAHAEEIVRSPLVLVPVDLRKEEHQYKLYPHEDDVEDNPALGYRLKQDFHVSLPKLSEFERPEEGEVDIGAFLEAVERSVKGAGWAVVREAWLAQFAFYKLAMYRDLEGPEVAEMAARHDVLSVLSEVAQAPPPQKFNLEEADRHYASSEGFPVLDADSSQLEVLERVRQGESLVVQGPPGTGKSQTIVNIIAQALRGGKRVLFVSEKRAALEVVHRRLKTLGLDRACLELHSHKANRKAAIHELMEAVRTSDRWGRDPELRAFEEYHTAKRRLDRYAQELHRPHGVIGRTAYQVHGQLAKLESAPTILSNLPIKSALEARPEDERNLRAVVSEISATGLWDGAETHPFRDADPLDRRAWMPELVERAAGSLQRAANGLDAFLASVSRELGIPGCDTASGCDRVRHTFEYLRGRPLPQFPSAWVTETTEFRKRIAKLSVQASENQQIIAQARAALGQAGASAIPARLAVIAPLLDGLQEAERGGFVARWKFARQAARSLRDAGAGKLGVRKAFPVLRAAYAIREGTHWFENNDQVLAQALGALYKGTETTFGPIQAGLRWIEDLPEGVGRPPSDVLVAAVAEGHPESSRESLDGRLSELDAKIEELHVAIAELAPLFAQGVEGRGFRETPLTVLVDWGSTWAREVRRLQEWLAYRRTLKQCDKVGLKDFLVECRKQRVNNAQLLPTFERALFFQWKREIYTKAPVLAEFDGSTHEAMVAQFCRLDRELRLEAVRSVLRTVATRIPDPLPVAEQQRLHKEAVKQRRHIPLRRLLPAIPNLLLAHKPCLLMSPLSVAIYLPKEHFLFDLVVFDEASQLPPADAIGAILRSHQVVILGDNKQLPPTDFFQAHAESDESGSEEEEVTAFESILDIATGALLPQPRLLWHYRSLDERLIAFSNRKFYGGELVTFPAPELDTDVTGVRFVFEPNGVYARGGSRTNPIEATRVVDLIIDHLSSRPHRTLGVIAMNVEQRDLIERELERRVQARPDLAPLIAEDRAPEPFFVKNLETVQGDERDDIIISVGYGPTELGGAPTLQFGPLNRSGGERRWNVAITRARYRTTLVASMRPERLDGVQATRWDGPKVMAEYMRYSDREGREEAIASGTGEPESDFELAIRDAMRGRGYVVDAQVGSSGFRIDLAVRNPDYPTRYILGIECDGKTYHSAKTARDRDRLRQEILEQRGWMLHRVWSTDWSANPEGALQRIVEKIETCRRSGASGVYKDEPSSPSGDNKTQGYNRAQTEPPSSVDEPRRDGDAARDSWLSPQEERGTAFRPSFELYREFKPRSSMRIRGYSPDDRLLFARYFAELVGKEGPIHEDLAIERMLRICRLERLGPRISEFLEMSVGDAVRNKEITRRGYFLWPPRERAVVPRRIDGDIVRRPEQIAPEEWDAAAVVTLQQLGVSTREDVIRGITAGFGYDRATVAIRAQADEAFHRLVGFGLLVVREELLYLQQPAQ